MAFKGHRREWAGKLSWNAFGGGKIPMHWDGNCLEEHDGFAPTSLFAKRNFWSCTEREYVLTPAQCIVQPGVGRPAGMWKAQPLELGMEPRELAAQAFPSPGDCKVFVLLLSLSHSFISSETHWFTGRWRGESSPTITKCPCEMEKFGFTQLCFEKKWRKEVRVAAWSLPTGQEGAGGACLGFLHHDAKRSLGDHSPQDAAKCCETQKKKQKKLY